MNTGETKVAKNTPAPAARPQVRAKGGISKKRATHKHVHVHAVASASAAQKQSLADRLDQVMRPHKGKSQKKWPRDVQAMAAYHHGDTRAFMCDRCKQDKTNLCQENDECEDDDCELVHVTCPACGEGPECDDPNCSLYYVCSCSCRCPRCTYDDGFDSD